MKIACVLAGQNYKPGDPAPKGYLAWQEWAEVQHKAGLRQVECGQCGNWKYPHELSGVVVVSHPFQRDGTPFNVEDPVCKECENAPAPITNLRDDLGPTSADVEGERGYT